MLNLLLIFICGMLYELTSTYWLFASEGLKPTRAALWSMLQAIVMLVGIERSINNLLAACCFVVGYSIGSAIGVAIEKRKRIKPIATAETI